MTRTSPETTLFARLRSACAAEWEAYTAHPFVGGLAGGNLPEACFRHYLIQDYLFLIHFARAYGLAAFKADSLDDIRAAAAGLAAMVDQEMNLHLAYCAEWGLGETEMAAASEAASVASARASATDVIPRASRRLVRDPICAASYGETLGCGDPNKRDRGCV